MYVYVSGIAKTVMPSGGENHSEICLHSRPSDSLLRERGLT